MLVGAATLGIHKDLSFRDYHAIDAWGSSSIRAMRKGPPARVMWERAHPKRDTDATTLGTQVHCRFITPDLFASAHVIKPEGMEFRSAENKKWRDDHLAAGRSILTPDRVALVGAICDALTEKRQVREAVEASDLREVSMVWADPATGEACKARPDWIDAEYLYDLKVSRWAEAPTLDYRAYVEGWMHQASHYLSGCAEWGMTLRGARLVVVSPAAPHYVRCLELKPIAVELCALDNTAALEAMKSCRLAGEWPGTPDEWVYVEPPAFALGETAVTFSGIEEE